MALGIQESVIFLHGGVWVTWVSIVGVLEKVVVAWPV